MIKKIVLAACLVVLAFGGGVKADELTELKEQLDQQRKLLIEMQKRIEQLEAREKQQNEKLEQFLQEFQSLNEKIERLIAHIAENEEV